MSRNTPDNRGNSNHRLFKSRFRQLRHEQLEDRRMLSVSYPDFSDPADLNLIGAASVTQDNRLRLTPAVEFQAGGAWHEIEKQYVSVGWETAFNFQLSDHTPGKGAADGFAFVIQNTNPSILGGGGGGLGYDGLANSLAIEFDTFQNPEKHDSSGSHISVHTNGTSENQANEWFSWGVYDTPGLTIQDGAVHTATVAYTAGTLDVFFDDPVVPVISVAIDLDAILNLDGGKAWLGFTAATGLGWSNHDILNWHFDYTTPFLVVGNAGQKEGDVMQPVLEFPVTVRRPDDTGSLAVQVDYATSDGTATAPNDYAAVSGTLSFNLVDGEKEATSIVTVPVHADQAVEDYETLFLHLSDPAGALVADDQGTGTIFEPNLDPLYPYQWGLHNIAQSEGTWDADIDVPAAWAMGTGDTSLVVAVIDTGVDYTDQDLYLNIWINQGEIPANIATSLTDTDGDGLITYRDLNDPANAQYVSDLNETGYIDAGDLLADPRWADGTDTDGNGYVDDVSGYDFMADVNDASGGGAGWDGGSAHGTIAAKILGAIGDNGIGVAGVCWTVQIMPLRFHDGTGNGSVVDAAEAIDYAVANGATISNNSWGSWLAG